MVTTQISFLNFFISQKIIYAKSDVQNYYIFYELSMIYEYARKKHTAEHIRSDQKPHHSLHNAMENIALNAFRVNATTSHITLSYADAAMLA